MSNDLSFEIKIVYDKSCSEAGFLIDFGFSSLIYNHFTDNYSLFDTGGKGKILIHNIHRFGIGISSIKKVIISHNHYDHVGGLQAICRENKEIEIFVPYDNLNSFSRTFPEVKLRGILTMTEIEKNVISSGQFSGTFTSEQGLFLRLKDNKLILLVGCAHPGLEKFIIKAQGLGIIKGIIGGFHGFRDVSYLNGIEFIGACHCTQHINSIKKSFSESFCKICVGTSLQF